MVWTASQMMASVGNDMPDSYWEGGVDEWTNFANALEVEAADWSDIVGGVVTVEVLKYLNEDAYQFAVTFPGIGRMTFDDVEDARRFIDLMWPEG